MDSDAPDAIPVAIGGSDADARLAAALRAAGARLVAADALVLVAKAGRDPDAVAACDAPAAEAGAALLAIVADAAGADAAYRGGATHVCVGTDPDALARALRFAARHARRLRGLGRGRRAGEAAPGAVARFLAARDDAAPATLALIAFTRFDVVNAAFGRPGGDALLAAAVARIGAAAPEAAVVERIDGAMVAIALTGGAQASEAALARIDAALAAPLPVEGLEASVGIRAGVAHRTPGEAAAALWRRAQEALDAARREEGGRLRYAAAPGGAAATRLAADLHRAIERREIDILFQPQVALADGRIVGVEALARWEHPEHGVLGAETLFAAARRADLGLALSEHIQSTALARAARWPAALDALRIAVNVTAGEVARAGFAARFGGRVADAGLAPARVTAEITETELMTGIDDAQRELAALRATGIAIAVDDFGTGYSSLAYLAALPLDYVKIDRSLTQDIAGGRRARAVVEGVIRIARDLGLGTIAEGVETAAQRGALTAAGCDIFQGFLCAPPLDDAALLRLVAR